MGYGVLTDGDTWDIYDLSKRGRFNKKRETRVSILSAPVEKNIEALKKLHRRNVLKLAQV